MSTSPTDAAARTDRELLEMAAKAAGLSLDTSGKNGGRRGVGFDMLGNAVLDWHNNVTWNPLEDDGDALRLAVDLMLRLTTSSVNARASTGWSNFPQGDVTEPVGTNPRAAMRRAIVRAAAAIAART